MPSHFFRLIRSPVRSTPSFPGGGRSSSVPVRRCQQNRTDVRLFNHYFSDQLLKDMAAKTYPIEFSTDVPWHLLGKKTGELAIALARGEKVEPIQYRVPVTAIVQEEAAAALAEVQKMDKQAIALLGQYGG